MTPRGRRDIDRSAHGNVECELPDGVKVFGRRRSTSSPRRAPTAIVATGNVVFTGPEGHIAADRLEYDTATGTGTFDVADGWSCRSEPGQTARCSAAATPDVHFHGERIEKLGPRRYRVTRGWWTTCEQPTPRWDFTSTSMVLNLEDYVVARHTVLRVKDVPLFYLPCIYYPIQSDDRATGFLMPTYGMSTFRGIAISNAFFWAIGRSQRRHVPSRLVHARRSGRRRRIPLRERPTVVRQLPRLRLLPQRNRIRQRTASTTSFRPAPATS